MFAPGNLTRSKTGRSKERKKRNFASGVKAFATKLAHAACFEQAVVLYYNEALSIGIREAVAANERP
jgi:hypothetical protein